MSFWRTSGEIRLLTTQWAVKISLGNGRSFSSGWSQQFWNFGIRSRSLAKIWMMKNGSLQMTTGLPKTNIPTLVRVIEGDCDNANGDLEDAQSSADDFQNFEDSLEVQDEVEELWCICLWILTRLVGNLSQNKEERTFEIACYLVGILSLLSRWLFHQGSEP